MFTVVQFYSSNFTRAQDILTKGIFLPFTLVCVSLLSRFCVSLFCRDTDLTTQMVSFLWFLRVVCGLRCSRFLSNRDSVVPGRLWSQNLKTVGLTLSCVRTTNFGTSETLKQHRRNPLIVSVVVSGKEVTDKEDPFNL